jgi:hypothetical protein
MVDQWAGGSSTEFSSNENWKDKETPTVHMLEES